MKSLQYLHSLIAHDVGDLLDVDPSRDILTMKRRSDQEGESFFTITLPTFEDGILAGIERGNLDQREFKSFRFRGRLPVFLRGFVSRLFDQNGTLLSSPDSEALRAVRQICSLSKKVERDVVSRRLRAAQAAYETTDGEVGRHVIAPDDLKEFQRVSDHLFCGLWNKLEDEISSFNLVPRHGPGAVAERFSSREKWHFPSWLSSLEDVFPSSLYTHYNGLRAPLPAVPLECEPPVRVVFVPKTMKAPRVIAIEPYARQFAQQAVSRVLYNELKRLFPGLDLFDQVRNQDLARRGSADGTVGTLDLSEASDRVSHLLVSSLARGWPSVREAFEACRSPRAELPDGRVIDLHKFASMGSALTFPLESMVFFTICTMGVMRARRTTSIGTIPMEISVFGDDIIVPTDAYTAVSELLEAFGLKVNRRKSYAQGPFRESCGGEFLSGLDVSIVKFRKDLPTSRQHVQQLASLAAFRNECYLRGLWKTARFADTQLAKLVTWKAAPVGHPSLSRWTYLEVAADRISPSYQRDEIRRPCVTPIKRQYVVDGEHGLLKWMLERAHSDRPGGGFLPTERPTALAINSRWHDLHAGVVGP